MSIENFQNRWFPILKPIRSILTCSFENSKSDERKKRFILIIEPFSRTWSILLLQCTRKRIILALRSSSQYEGCVCRVDEDNWFSAFHTHYHPTNTNRSTLALSGGLAPTSRKKRQEHLHSAPPHYDSPRHLCHAEFVLQGSHNFIFDRFFPFWTNIHVFGRSWSERNAVDCKKTWVAHL